MILVDQASLLYPVLYRSDDYELTKEDGTEVTYIYTFLYDLLSLYKKFNSNEFIILFDSKLSFRKQSNASYKSTRKDVPEDIKKKRQSLYEQIHILKDVLTEMGISWVEIDGLEADDLIASIVFNNKLSHFITISTDHDLWQTLGKNNCMYLFSKQQFLHDYDIEEKFPDIPACDYWRIMSLSGCKTDEVEPVANGIGEKTAYKYLTGKLKTDSKAYKSIESNLDKQKDNEELVRLPHKNTPPLFVKDLIRHLNYKGFIKKCKELELESCVTDSDWKKFFREH